MDANYKGFTVSVREIVITMLYVSQIYGCSVESCGCCLLDDHHKICSCAI